MSGDPPQGVSVRGEQGGHRLVTGLSGEPRGAPGDRLHPGIPTVVELPP